MEDKEMTAEIHAIKSAFAENDSLLKKIRSLLIGLEVSKEDKELIKNTFSDPMLVKVVKKTIFPTLDADIPLGQINDFWSSASEKIQNSNRDTIAQTIQARERLLKMLEKVESYLIDPFQQKINLGVNINIISDPLGIDLLTRNLYLRTIDTGMMMLKIIAGEKKETAEEAKKRLTQDSAK